MAHAYEVYLLGGLQLVVNGHPLSDAVWRRRKARQLFKCLLTRSGRRLLKEEAIEILWPEAETDPDTSNTNLRTVVHALRRALRDDTIAAQPELFFVERDSIGIRPEADCWVDADAFLELVVDAHSADQ